MKIHAHILAYNEEKLLPFTLDYYSSFCEKIFMYDNMSTDGSDDIYKKYPKVQVIKWESNNEINELNYCKIKSTSYKDLSRDADWVISCDCDEYIYHPNLIEKLKEYDEMGINLPKTNGYEMFSEEFPIYDGQLITEKIKEGFGVVETLCKQILFKPNVDINYGVGAHSNVCKNCITNETPELKVLHYKFLNLDYVINRYQHLQDRLSDFNKQHGFGHHYNFINAINMTNKIKENKFKVI